MGLKRGADLSKYAVSCPGLRKWHDAVERVPKGEMLPIGLGGQTAQPNLSAFLGDKILSGAVALAICKAKEQQSLKQLSELQSVATSNRLLCDELVNILPMHADQSVRLRASTQTHDVGTMVEAAVAAVHANGGGESAIAELAAWLVAKAAEIGSYNAKGVLLERGGTVVPERVGGPDHLPTWRAVASLDGEHASATAYSAKEAEQSAARELLATCGLMVSPPSMDRLVIESPGLLQEGAWRPVHFPDEHKAANCEDGETLQQWWFRGASRRRSAIHRAIMAPHVFTGVVCSVDIWQRQLYPFRASLRETIERTHGVSEDTEERVFASSLALVAYDKEGVPYVTSFSGIGPSQSKANQRAALQANDAIKALIASILEHRRQKIRGEK